MKRTVQAICVILILSIILVVPANAEGETRASAFFASYGTDLEKTSSASFRVWFDVDANAAMMNELGVSTIEIYSSSDQQSWTKVKTYTKENYSQMTDTNVYSHTGYVTFTQVLSGKYYTALVTFYARNSTGFSEREMYTEIIKM